MLDIRLIREKPDFVKQELAKVGAELDLIDRILELDGKWRALVQSGEEQKATLKSQSKQVGRMKDAAERQRLIEENRQIREEISALDEQAAALQAERDQLMLMVPNLPRENVPIGPDENSNTIVRTEGEPPPFDFEPKPHWELGESLGILDFERGVKLSGTRFYVMMREGSHLQRALINFMLDMHTEKHGYTEVYPPFMVKEQCLVGTGNLPKFKDNLYHDVEEDYWWVPTAEVPLTNLHRDEILEADELPRCYVAFTPCFRREKMSAGKDVRGIKRGHQFDKVELMKYAKPEESDAELMKLLNDAEDICRALGLHYRIVQMCTGDLSFVACIKYDIEIWAPGCGEWLEVSSCSLFRDFQARRANLRYRPAPGEKPQFVHTMNGSGLALPRVVISVLETFQQADGSVTIPPALVPYMHGIERIVPK